MNITLGNYLLGNTWALFTSFLGSGIPDDTQQVDDVIDASDASLRSKERQAHLTFSFGITVHSTWYSLSLLFVRELKFS